MDEKRIVADVVIVIGRLLSSANECDGLVGGGIMASVCPTDGGRGGISDREERFENSSDLASEGGSGTLAYIRLFFGVCFMDDVGTHGEGEWLGG